MLKIYLNPKKTSNIELALHLRRIFKILLISLFLHKRRQKSAKMDFLIKLSLLISIFITGEVFLF